jgi:glycosyltransferase involved in cell wall biosynthesis
MSIKLRIAIVVSHPIQHFCPQYASFAKNSNIKLKVFFASTLGYKSYVDEKFGQEIKWTNLYLDEFDHCFLNNGELLLSNSSLDAPELDKELELYKPDLVIMYGYFHKLQRRVHRWARQHNTRLAYISDSERNRKIIRWKEWLKYPYLYWFFSRIDCFLTVGNANEAYYSYHGVPESKFMRMHFPIDIRTYSVAYEKRYLGDAIRSKYAINQQTIVVSVVGKLVSWKNQADIIDSLKLLEQMNIKADALIIGTGADIEILKEKAGQLSFNKVHFAGFVNPTDLPAYYAATDIYIHPSFFEPHSLAISEAIYMGCPVIVSDRCGSYGADDDVQDNINGFVFKCGDIRDLAEKIALLSKDINKREQFGKVSHAHAREFQQCAHIDIIEKLVPGATVMQVN